MHSGPARPSPGENDGPPRNVTIYRTPEGWRFALATQNGSVLCGRYSELPPAAAFEEARAVAESKIRQTGREFFDLNLEVEWRPGDQPEWWDGTVRPSA